MPVSPPTGESCIEMACRPCHVDARRRDSLVFSFDRDPKSCTPPGKVHSDQGKGPDTHDRSRAPLTTAVLASSSHKQEQAMHFQ